MEFVLDRRIVQAVGQEGSEFFGQVIRQCLVQLLVRFGHEAQRCLVPELALYYCEYQQEEKQDGGDFQ